MVQRVRHAYSRPFMFNGFGAVNNSVDTARFVADVKSANAALEELDNYATKIRMRATLESVSLAQMAQNWFSDTDPAVQLNTLADQIERFATSSGPIMLQKAVKTGSFVELRKLQTATRKILDVAREYSLKFLDLVLPPAALRFVKEVIWGTAVDVANLANKVPKLVDPKQSPWPWIIGIGVTAYALSQVNQFRRIF